MTTRKIKRPVHFTVEGVGRFPVDMLRYDACYPARGDDAAAIATSLDVRKSGVTHTIRLTTLRAYMPDVNPAAVGPTVDRWLSFGWRVVDWPERSWR